MTEHRPDAERIVVLVKRFPRLSETFILNEFLQLRREGVPVDLFSIMDPHEKHSDPVALALVPEVTYLQIGSLLGLLPAALRTAARHPLGTARAIGWTITRHTRAAVRNLVHAMVLVDLLAKGRPAHVHAHFLHSPAALALIAHKISGQSYSLTGHAKDIYTALEQNLTLRCQDAAFVTSCTAANVEHLRAQLAGVAIPILLARHGVHPAAFGHVEHRPVPGRILSVGRLVPKKGFDVLLRACAELDERGIPFSLDVIGAGPLLAELTELAATLGIADRVRFLGSRTHQGVLTEMATAEIFALAPVVMPDGDRDGIPNVILEAMATGLPVVATAVSGIPEVVTAESGVLVEQRRPDLTADALEMLLCDERLRARFGAAAQRFVREDCSWQNAIAPLRELLTEQLAPSARSVR